MILHSFYLISSRLFPVENYESLRLWGCTKCELKYNSFDIWDTCWSSRLTFSLSRPHCYNPTIVKQPIADIFNWFFYNLHLEYLYTILIWIHTHAVWKWCWWRYYMSSQNGLLKSQTIFRNEKPRGFNVMYEFVVVIILLVLSSNKHDTNWKYSLQCNMVHVARTSLPFPR